MSKAPKEIQLTGDQLKGIFAAIEKNPTWILRLPHIVHWLAKMRREQAAESIDVFDGDKSAVHHHAIPHNLSQLGLDEASHRALALIYPLSAVSEVWRNASKMKLLSIGPRSEAELFHLMGHGFVPENITAVDLLSYSELVHVGDMHALQYPDASFDIVIMGWVLAYSSDNKKAAAEAMRVLKPGGYCAVGCVCEAELPEAELAASQVVGGLKVQSPDETTGGEKIVSRYFNIGQLKRLFEDHIERVFFENEPIEKYSSQRDNVILVFRKKFDALNTSTERTPSPTGSYPPIRNIWDPA